MSYTVTLELPDGAMTLADCGDGDRPRQAPCAPDQPKATSYVAGSGFIGGADGPTAVVTGADAQSGLHAACSSLHFESVQADVEWCAVFQIKEFEDRTFTLL